MLKSKLTDLSEWNFNHFCILFSMLQGFPFWVSFSQQTQREKDTWPVPDAWPLCDFVFITLCPSLSLSLFCGPDHLLHSPPYLTPASSICIQNITSQKWNTETLPPPQEHLLTILLHFCVLIITKQINPSQKANMWPNSMMCNPSSSLGGRVSLMRLRYSQWEGPWKRG